MPPCVDSIAGRSRSRRRVADLACEPRPIARMNAGRSVDVRKSPAKGPVAGSAGMPSRERAVDRGRRRCRAAVRRVADDGRIARAGAGLSQADVGRAIDSSHARVGRFERGEIAYPNLEFLVSYCAVLGLDLALRTYPAGDPIRDRAQMA